MTALYLLIPLSLLLVGIAIAVFIWAVNSGQFDDLDSPAWRILDDDEDNRHNEKPSVESNSKQTVPPQEVPASATTQPSRDGS